MFSLPSHAANNSSSRFKRFGGLQAIQETVTNIRDKNSSFVNPPLEYKDNARDIIESQLRTDNDMKSMLTSSSTIASSSSVASSIFSVPISSNSSFSLPIIKEITLKEALPNRFDDMYSKETLNCNELLPNGRPSFTRQALGDWEINDIRSLLIIPELKPEWNSTIPTILQEGIPKFRIILLPLSSPIETIISTLVNSDIYLEANLDYDFKVTSATYIVQTAIHRKEQTMGIPIHGPILHMTKIEWRNIIENYLLNMGVEAQCRHDFRERCHDYKLWKIEQKRQTQTSMPPPSVIPGKQSLLKRTLLKNHNQKDLSTPTHHTITLTKEEKRIIWSQCQAQVYQRLGLDWIPDKV